MERLSRNSQSSSNDGKFQAIFASPNIYFTENARWVPLNKFRILDYFATARNVVPKIVDFIQASLLRPGFELSQTVDFKKGVTFCDNSICVQPINHRKSQTPF